MRTLYLHIGQSKTGSTSIQAFLKKNKKNLLLQGFYTTDLFKTNGLADMLLPFRYSNRGFLRRKNYQKWLKCNPKGTSESADDISLVSWKKFVNEVNQSPSTSSWILSSEDLYLNTTEDEDIKSLRDDLYGIFDKVFVLAYVRQPIYYAISSFSQSIKGGKSQLSQIPDVKDRVSERYWNYHERLKPWLHHFGTDSICLNRFQKSQFIELSLLDTFSRSCGFNSLNFNYPKTSNPSLSLTGLRLLLYINKNYTVSALRRNAVIKEISFNYADGTKLFPSKDQFSRYECASLSADLWLKSTFFPDESFLWDDPSSHIVESNIDLQSLSKDEMNEADDLLSRVSLLYN